MRLGGVGLFSFVVCWFVVFLCFGLSVFVVRLGCLPVCPVLSLLFLMAHCLYKGTLTQQQLLFALLLR